MSALWRTDPLEFLSGVYIRKGRDIKPFRLSIHSSTLEMSNHWPPNVTLQETLAEWCVHGLREPETTKDWLVVSKWGFQKSGYPKSSKVRPFYTIEMYWNPWFWGTPILENLLKCFNFDIEARVLYVSCMGWKHQPDLCLGHNLGPRNLDMWFFSHLWLYTVYIYNIYI